MSLEAAIELAARAHRGQVDKAGEPYILHPLRVMMKFADDERRIVAVLHDTVEDAGLEIGYIKGKFGERVATAIDALSRREGESYTDFIERCGANELARAVKWADISDNSDLTRIPNISAADIKRNEKYRAAADRLTAIAIEAGTATTPESGVVHESAVAQPIAQIPVRNVPIDPRYSPTKNDS